VLKELIEAYPGFILAGGEPHNPVRGKFGGLLAKPGSRGEAGRFAQPMEQLAIRFGQQFPSSYPATNKTIADDLSWMRAELAKSQAA